MGILVTKIIHVNTTLSIFSKLQNNLVIWNDTKTLVDGLRYLLGGEGVVILYYKSINVNTIR